MKPQVKMQATAQVGDEWRRWIAENLMLGVAPPSIAAVLVQAGIAARIADAEIETALRSPYLHGARRLVNRLRKRDWVLSIQSKLNRIGANEIERRERLSGPEFLEQYYRTNRPVIITGMLEHYPARTKWNLDYFAQERLKDRMVEVQFGRNSDTNYELNSIAHKR